MSEHLAADQLERYRDRTMSPAELLAADDHLGTCKDCLNRVSAGEAEQSTFSFLRAGLRADAAAETHHLLYEQLEAYVDGAADDVESEVIESHLGMCPSCGTEVDDLRALKAEKTHPEIRNLSGKAPSLWGKFFSLWHRPAYGISLKVLAAVVIVLIVGWVVLLPLRRQVDNLRAQVRVLEEANGSLQQQASTIAALEEQVAQLQSQVQGGDSSSLLAVALNDGGGLLTLDREGNLTGLQLSPSLRQRIAATLSRGLQGVPDLTELSGSNGTLLGGGSDAVPFALISPVGVVTETNRPSFRWRQLGGTATYAVRLFDSSFNRVMSSPQLTATQWTASAPLERGRVYLWQVVAQKDGKEIVSPVPPAPEAKFRVLEQERADELAQAKRDYPTSHLVLGTLFAQAGLLDEAEREYKALATANPNSPVARKLLNSVRALRTSR